ncbi:MAG TPA: TetR/AcrR family transcriptional regulator [Egibacteraceae bacterium]|nr:TetR/AcrR family transcriptional regulator [Egibacteraceae bacterium]
MEPRAVVGRAGEPRTRLSAQERRQQLLEVAGGLFAEHGFHGLSMEQLADAAGVSKPVLYQHFPSKRELYLALMQDAIAEMESQIRKALEGTRDNRARVEGAIAAYFDFVEDRRSRLIFGAYEAADPDARDAVEEANRRTAEAVGQLIAEDAGLDRAAAGLLATALRGLATEAARWWTDHDADAGLDKAKAVRFLSRLAWRGLGSFQKD